VLDASPAIVRVDAKCGLAPYALECGLARLESKARACGIAALAVTNAFHFRCCFFQQCSGVVL
jgi:delta1-piperideine-2-carboxylate reductase